MAISFLSGTSTQQTTSNLGVSWVHGVSNSNELMFVDVNMRTLAASGVSITYSGASVQNLTMLGRIDNGTTNRLETWYLENPQTGNNTLQLTLSGTTVRYTTIATTYGGTIASPIGAITSGTATSTTPNITLTTTIDNSWIHNTFGIGTRTPTFTASAPNTLRVDAFNGATPNGNQTRTDANDLSTTTAGAYNVSGTYSVSVGWLGWAVEMKPRGTTKGMGYITGRN